MRYRRLSSRLRPRIAYHVILARVSATRDCWRDRSILWRSLVTALSQASS